MKNESVKKSLEKSKNVLEEKRKNCQAKNLHKKKTHTFTIIAMNCVQEQLIKDTVVLSIIQKTSGQGFQDPIRKCNRQ